jgi:hypothetical protein
VVSIRAVRPRAWIGGALAFGVLRTLGGWVVGVPTALALLGVFGDLKDSQLIMGLALPRFLLSAALIHWLFRPRGGWWETTLWAVANVALTSAIDRWLYANYRSVEWLWMPWC